MQHRLRELCRTTSRIRYKTQPSHKTNAVNQWKAHQSWQYFIRDATCRKHKKAQEQKTSKWKRKQCRIKETQCKTKISNAKEARFWNARMQDFQIQDVGCAHKLHKMPQKQSKGEALQSTHEAYISYDAKKQNNSFFCTVLDAQPGILKSQKDRTQKEGPGMKTSWNHEEQWTRTRRTWRTKKFVLDLIFWCFDTPFDHPLRLWLRTRAPVSVTVPWKFQAWRPQYVPLAPSRKHSKVNYVITKDVLQRLISFWMDSKIATPNSGYTVFAVRAAYSGGRFTSQQAMLENTGKGPSRKTELVETRTTCFCRPRQKKDQG